MSEIKAIKKTITRSIKDLDYSDFIDICVFIKSHVNNYTMINETPKGTFIDLDKLDDQLIYQLNNIITTKLQRIARQ